MYIIGFNLSHDYSACLIKDGEIVAAIALERITRVKRGIIEGAGLGRAINDLITYCLEAGKIKLSDIDYFIANTTETMNSEEEKSLLRNQGVIPENKILSMPHPSHHLSHASAAFYTSGFDEAAVLVVDCYGSLMGKNRESESGFVFKHNKFPNLVFRNIKYGTRIAGQLDHNQFVIPKDLQGAGEIYRIITLLLGFVQDGTYYDDAGKTMGLAPYGKLISETPIFMKVKDGEIDYSGAYDFLLAHNLVTECGQKCYLNVRNKSSSFSQFHKDLAAQVQYELEEICLFLVNKLKKETGQQNLVLSGGTFLNSVTNYRILKESGFDQLYILPSATDDGNAIGTALFAYHNIVETRFLDSEPKEPKNFYFGKSYESDSIKQALKSYDADFKEMDSFNDIVDFTAEALENDKIIGWFQGGSEFGPRALGHRSILANPMSKNIKDILNARVKFREGFRPFAPITIAEKAKKYFEMDDYLSPYMLIVCPVNQEYQTVMPGITHIDETARVQTLEKNQNPLLYEILEEFEERTGAAVLLNTSFNLKGMPIVESPLDALECFYATNMDLLILDRFIVFAPKFNEFIPVRNQFSVHQWGNWLGTEESFLPDIIEISCIEGKKIVQDFSKNYILSTDIWKLLKYSNGQHTIREIGEKINISLDKLLDMFLKLYRDGLIYWKHLEHLSN